MKGQQPGEEPAIHEPPPPLVRATAYVCKDPATIPPRVFLDDERHLIRRFVSGTVAPGGVGKSSLTTVEALGRAAGRNLFSGKRRPPLRAWLWNGEDPLEELERRVEAVRLYYDIPPHEIDGRLFLDSGRDVPFIIASEGRGGLSVAKPLVDAIIAEIKARAIDALTIDPFVASHAVSENDNAHINAVVRQWARVADETGCAIDLVHHTRKSNGSTEASADNARGAGSFVDAMRHVRVLTRMTEEEAAKAGVDHPKLYFRVESAKANLLRPAERATWRHLASVSLGNAAGEYPSDEIQVATAWTWPDAFADVTVSDLKAVQLRISEGEYRDDPRADSWVGNAVAKALDLDLAEPSVRASVKTMLKEWRTTGALKAVERTDKHRKARTFIEVGEWA